MRIRSYNLEPELACDSCKLDVYDRKETMLCPNGRHILCKKCAKHAFEDSCHICWDGEPTR